MYTGLSPEESYGWGWKTAIHPDDLPALAEKWEALRDVNTARECEVRLRRSDGVFRWFSLRCEPLHDENRALVRWYGTAADIEILRQTEEKLREDERELRRITDAIPQTIVVLDPSGAPLYANQATLDYTGSLLKTCSPRAFANESSTRTTSRDYGTSERPLSHVVK